MLVLFLFLSQSSQHAQRESVELFQTLFFKDRDPGDPACVADAIIVQIRTNGVVVHVPRYTYRQTVVGGRGWVVDKCKVQTDIKYTNNEPVSEKRNKFQN